MEGSYLFAYLHQGGDFFLGQAVYVTELRNLFAFFGAANPVSPFIKCLFGHHLPW